MGSEANPYWNVVKAPSRVQARQTNSRDKKGDKENEANYTKCSSHKTLDEKYFFERRITKPKTVKQCLQRSNEAASFLKM